MIVDEEDVNELLEAIKQFNAANRQAYEANVVVQSHTCSILLRRAYLRWADENIHKEGRTAKAMAVRNLLIPTSH